MVVVYQEFLSYCGRYEVYSNPDQVVHQIKISSFPNWIGQNQIRKFEFKENNLILSTDTIGSSRHKLVWEKIKNKN
ncbi:MAG: lipocalin-like domain-containing protein [Bacteroidetes bacterium]|nr:lipocalin-like domain-containing protein [Bacteroidota bacterium]